VDCVRAADELSVEDLERGAQARFCVTGADDVSEATESNGLANEPAADLSPTRGLPIAGFGTQGLSSQRFIHGGYCNMGYEPKCLTVLAAFGDFELDRAVPGTEQKRRRASQLALFPGPFRKVSRSKRCSAWAASLRYFACAVAMGRGLH
jgi:hypothetical protein